MQHNLFCRYYEVAFGSKSLPSTWRQCVLLAKTRTGAALTAEFLMKYANYQSQEQVHYNDLDFVYLDLKAPTQTYEIRCIRSYLTILISVSNTHLNYVMPYPDFRDIESMSRTG